MSGAAGASAAAAAAAAARMRAEEEEQMSNYSPAELNDYEFKIIRSATGTFKHAHKLQTILAQEAQCGWEMVEKFDNGRVRLKRRVEWRERDATSAVDAYRTAVGTSEIQLAMWIIVGITFGVGLLIAVVIMSKH